LIATAVVGGGFAPAGTDPSRPYLSFHYRIGYRTP